MRIFFTVCVFLVIEICNVYVSAGIVYHDHEIAKLRAFLMQESAVSGVKNFQQIGLSSLDDVSWISVSGLSWNSMTYNLEGINWPNKNLSGHIDVSGCQSLRYLLCSFNDIKSVHINDCPSLMSVDFYTNDLDEIDVSVNPKLSYLRLGYNNIRIVDVSNNPNLGFLCCTGNQVQSLDVSNKALLYTVYCNANILHTLIAENCPELETLLCTHNSLTSLSLNNLPKLTSFSCFFNEIKELQITDCNSLESLLCNDNELSVLDVSSCKNLTTLNCSNNQLTSINIEGCRHLTSLSCDNNYIASLDVSNAPLLDQLACKNNNFTFSTLPLSHGQIKNYAYTPQRYVAMDCKYDDVDLSDFYTIDDTESIYTWFYKNKRIDPLESHEGRFVFDESYIGETFICRVQNNIFPLLVMHYDVTFTSGESGNEIPNASGVTVYAGGQTIHITADTPALVSVYSLRGALLTKTVVSAGHTDIPIERGMYVVVVNGRTSHKVIVR